MGKPLDSGYMGKPRDEYYHNEQLLSKTLFFAPTEIGLEIDLPMAEIRRF